MNYTNLLREHQLKATPQRLAILTLMQKMGHLDVEELYKQIKESFSSISLATLYKNINAMLEKELITEVKIPHLKARYEITKEPHIHLLCENCKEFLDLDIDLHPLISNASHKSSYELHSSSVVLSGLCKSCQTQ